MILLFSVSFACITKKKRIRIDASESEYVHKSIIDFTINIYIHIFYENSKGFPSHNNNNNNTVAFNLVIISLKSPWESQQLARTRNRTIYLFTDYFAVVLSFENSPNCSRPSEKFVYYILYYYNLIKNLEVHFNIHNKCLTQNNIIKTK